MSKVLVTESNLENIADAIREKSGTSSTYAVSEMAEAIRSMVAGGGLLIDSLPIGLIVPFGNETPPLGWLVCDGSAVSRTEYADLFEVIGTKYGAGDGSTTFNLPNKKGKVSVGLDVNDTDFNDIGKTGGEKSHVLSVYEMPQHNHAQYLDGNDSNPAGGGAAYDWMISNKRYAYTGGDLAAYSGANQPHNNLQPYEVDCWIIKAQKSSLNDTLPIGTEVDYDGDEVPDGWEEVTENPYNNNIISCTFTTNHTIATEDIETIKLDTFTSVGDKLTLNSEGKIIIGSGIKKIRMSANVNFQTVTSGLKQLLIYKNSSAIAQNVSQISVRTTLPIAALIYEVAEGDVIYLAVKGAINDVLRRNMAHSNFTIEVVE